MLNNATDYKRSWQSEILDEYNIRLSRKNVYIDQWNTNLVQRNIVKIMIIKSQCSWNTLYVHNRKTINSRQPTCNPLLKHSPEADFVAWFEWLICIACDVEYNWLSASTLLGLLCYILK